MTKKLEISTCSDRKAAIGIWTDANSWHEAANVLVASGNKKITHPTYSCVARTLELVLKAYLLANDVSLSTLKKHIGHDLERAVTRANALGLEKLYEISKAEHVAIRMINPYYLHKEFEYRVTGFKTYPTVDVLLALNEKLLRVTRALCRKVYD